MQIVTGYAGQAHITSNDDQGRNQGTFGEDSYVLSVGSKFEPTLVSANQLRIADGEAVMQGVHFRVEPSSFDTVSIANGTQGRNRKDLVVCRYQKNGSTGVESCQWVVIQGTATTGTATRPDFVRGDILDGALSADMPFFEIVLSGVNVTAVNRIYNTVLSMEELQTLASQNRDSISVLNTKMSEWEIYAAGAGSGTSADVPLAAGTRGVILCGSVSDTARGILGFGVNTSGAASASKIAGATGLTITNGTRKITITNNGNAFATFFVLTSPA